MRNNRDEIPLTQTTLKESSESYAILVLEGFGPIERNISHNSYIDYFHFNNKYFKLLQRLLCFR